MLQIFTASSGDVIYRTADLECQFTGHIKVLFRITVVITVADRVHFIFAILVTL